MTLSYVFDLIVVIHTYIFHSLFSENQYITGNDYGVKPKYICWCKTCVVHCVEVTKTRVQLPQYNHDAHKFSYYISLDINLLVWKSTIFVMVINKNAFCYIIVRNYMHSRYRVPIRNWKKWLVFNVLRFVLCQCKSDDGIDINLVEWQHIGSR